MNTTTTDTTDFDDTNLDGLNHDDVCANCYQPTVRDLRRTCAWCRGPRSICGYCGSADLPLCAACGLYQSLADDLAHAVHDIHTGHVPHVSARLSADQIAKIDRLVATVGEQTIETTRSAVLRRVISLGVSALEHELGLDGDGQAAQGDEVAHG